MHFRGVVYRAHNPMWAWPPVSGDGAARRGGRFNRRGVPAFYTSLSSATAVREENPARETMQPILICSYKVDSTPVFDALDAKQLRKYGVTRAQLAGRWERAVQRGEIPASQALADRLIAEGFAGIRVPSFALGAGEDDINLVLWSFGPKKPSRVVLIDDNNRLRRAIKRTTKPRR